jgi:alpha-ketoglutarate-dependent taurine dioxygenase
MLVVQRTLCRRGGAVKMRAPGALLLPRCIFVAAAGPKESDDPHVSTTSASLHASGRLLDLSFSAGGELCAGGAKSARFHGVWLRDHCRCPSCTHPVTLQRVRAADDLPSPTLAGDSVRLLDGGSRVAVTWPEGHESVFESAWLRRHAYWPVCGTGKGTTPLAAPPPQAPAPTAAPPSSPLPSPSSPSSFGAGEYDPVLDTRTRVVWDSSTLPPLPSLSVPAPDFLASDDALLRALRTLRDVGFFLVTGVEPTVAATETVCRRVGFLRETLYGPGMWTTHVAPDPSRISDTAFTAAALPPHTDGNYLQDPPGIQVFHAIVADASGGGDSVLIDGFAVAEAMRASSPAAFAFLSRARLLYHHTDPEAVVRARRPVFVCDEDGTPRAFSFNNDDRDILSLAHLPDPTASTTGAGYFPSAAALARTDPDAAAAAIPRFYEHLHVLRSLLADPRLQVWHGLRPGTVLIFDNTRVLHGRAAFPVTSGRTLAGTYIGREEWESRLRVLHARKSR